MKEAAMHKLAVLYPHPDDAAAFMRYYTTRHLPLAATLPGLVSCSYGEIRPLGPDAAPYFLAFEALFDDEQACLAALGSAEGKAVAADVSHYSPKGATLLHYDVTAADGGKR
jgi:uncharacterized protein (TIGR02118 family)